MDIAERREKRKRTRRRISWSIGIILIICIISSIAINTYYRFNPISYNSNRFDVVDKIDMSVGFKHYTIYELRVKSTGAHYYLTGKGELVPVYGFNGVVKTSSSNTDEQ